MLEILMKDLITKIVIEINKPENKKKIEKEIFKPALSSFADRIYPYVSLLFIMYILNLVLIIIILVLLINKKNI
jgi:hypothetical protein